MPNKELIDVIFEVIAYEDWRSKDISFDTHARAIAEAIEKRFCAIVEHDYGPSERNECVNCGAKKVEE